MGSALWRGGGFLAGEAETGSVAECELRAYRHAMDREHQVTGHLDDQWLADLDRVCEHLGITRDHAVTTAVLRFVDQESRDFPSEWDDLPGYRTPEIDWESVDKATASFDAFLQRGQDDLDAGRTVPHEEVVRMMRERYAARHAAE